MPPPDVRRMQERFGAVMPRADRDTHAVEERTEVKGMDLPDAEGENTALMGCFAEDEAIGKFTLEASRSIVQEVFLMRCDGF